MIRKILFPISDVSEKKITIEIDESEATNLCWVLHYYGRDSVYSTLCEDILKQLKDQGITLKK